MLGSLGNAQLGFRGLVRDQAGQLILEQTSRKSPSGSFHSQPKLWGQGRHLGFLDLPEPSASFQLEKIPLKRNGPSWKQQPQALGYRQGMGKSRRSFPGVKTKVLEREPGTAFPETGAGLAPVPAPAGHPPGAGDSPGDPLALSPHSPWRWGARNPAPSSAG